MLTPIQRVHTLNKMADHNGIEYKIDLNSTPSDSLCPNGYYSVSGQNKKNVKKFKKRTKKKFSEDRAVEKSKDSSESVMEK